MTKVDLITGFLGTGKTTFIKKYSDYLIRKGEKIGIIENEFGGVPVDSVILKGEGRDVSQLSGGCMCCNGKADFQRLLKQMAEADYDRILVEPSGIYDVDEFFEIMLNDPVKDCCEIGSIITIADAKYDTSLSYEANYIMFSQLLCAGKVILSKSQMADAAEIKRTIEELNRIVQSHGSTRVLQEENDICQKSWEDLTDEEFAELSQCGYQVVEHERDYITHGSVFTARAMGDCCRNREQLETQLREIFSNEEYGDILRIKGHIADLTGQYYEINCSSFGFYIQPAEVKRGLYIVIGQNFNEEKVREAFVPRVKGAIPTA